MNVIDLFAGCGGLSKGFIDAGYNVLIGIDNDEAALESFRHNHEGAKGINIDLSKEGAFSKIKEEVKNENIDVVIAGPPCQGFSLSGPRNFEDERNKLYLSVIDAVKEFSPQAFVIENVPGMATLYKGQVKEEIIRRFEEMGYTVNSQILLATDYGVPQARRRLFFVGLKNAEEKFEFPKPILTPDKYITCREAISDLPTREDSIGKNIDVYTSEPTSEYQKKMRGECEVLYNHVGTNHTQLVIEVISQVPEGGNHKDLPPGVGTSRKFNEAWTRYHGNRPSKTIDTGHRNHFHYELNRVPTVRENARLQSFRDDFVFFGNKTQQYRQVGNAVPPLFGYHIGKQLLRYLKGEK